MHSAAIYPNCCLCLRARVCVYVCASVTLWRLRSLRCVHVIVVNCPLAESSSAFSLSFDQLLCILHAIVRSRSVLHSLSLCHLLFLVLFLLSLFVREASLRWPRFQIPRVYFETAAPLQFRPFL